ncbi:MAG: hypothetical protein N3G20_04805 [Verrucomicrobiae bacterium]|nr:hypothetical protein [Verrucomicrobiae bacterium]
MQTLLVFLCWCLLFVLCWPVAVLALVLFPIVWVISIPFRVAAIVVNAALALLKSILLLPARVFGHKG